MSATVQLRVFTGASEGTGANAETGVTLGNDDNAISTAGTPKPSATGTNYSWIKQLAPYVTAGGGTSNLSARQVKMAASPALPTGIKLHFKDGGATYTQSTDANNPADSGSSGATPATYTEMTTSYQTYHAASEAAVDNDRNGDFCYLLQGVADTYAGGGGSIDLPDLDFQMTES